MKVKDLRDYLSLHDISTEMCREKEELVFLVLGQQPVISEEARTHVPTLSPDFSEQQAFLTQPHSGTIPPTSPSLPSSPAQATSVAPVQAQENQQVGLCAVPVHLCQQRARVLLPAVLWASGVGPAALTSCSLPASEGRQWCFLDIRLMLWLSSAVLCIEPCFCSVCF